MITCYDVTVELQKVGVARSATKMPTQSTQTAWSWLQDLAEVARLSRKGGEFSLSSAEIDRWLQEEATTVDENNSPTSPREAVNSSQRDRTATPVGEASVDGVNPPQSLPVTDKHRQEQVLGGEGELHRGGSGTVADEEEQTERIGIPALVQEDAGILAGQEYGEKHRSVREGLKLPPIANEQTQQNANQAGDESLNRNQQEVVSASEELLHLPPIAAQLEALEFPSDNESDSEEDEGNSGTECEEHTTPPFPNVQSFNLPWPAILQYLRESESMASKYFSLASDRLGTTSELGLLPSGNTLCDFCGKVTPKRSLLISAGGTEVEESPFCCAEYQEFCLLTATCLRQLVVKREEERPGMISVHPGKKVARKTAQQKALAMMRRKKKWEALQRKLEMRKLQSSSFYSLTKQTRTIQFSLLSPGAGWMVDADASKQKWGANQRRKGKQTRRAKERSRKLGVLPPAVLEGLSKEAPPPAALECHHYGRDRPLATFLPDRTGQCYYPSGNIAVLVFSKHMGVLGYLVYEDDSRPHLLAYMDELGRTCCHNRDGSIRLLLAPTHGLVCDQQGQVKARWTSREQGNSLFQPLTLSLNKHISIRCGRQDCVSMIFSAQQQQIKFSIVCKLKDEALEALAVPPTADIRELEEHLKKERTKISYLLGSLHHSSRAQKLAELKLAGLKAVYSPTKKTRSDSRKRTRSTGELNLRRSPKKDPSALRPLM